MTSCTYTWSCCSFSGMNDPIEHATGLEKYELLAKQAGNDVSRQYI